MNTGQYSTQGTVERLRESLYFRFIDTTHSGCCHLKSHFHDRSGITLVTQGRYRETFSQGSFDCVPGSIVFKPAGLIHSNRYGDQGARAIHLEIADNELLRQNLQLPNRILELKNQPFRNRLNQICCELGLTDQTSALVLDSLGMEILGEFVQQDRPRFRIPRPPHWIKNAIEMIESNPGFTISLSAIAAEIDIPPRTLARHFRWWTGKSIGEYSRQIQISKAKQQLLHTSTEIAIIASSLGFSDQSHFTNVFHRETGMTPLRFRIGGR